MNVKAISGKVVFIKTLNGVGMIIKSILLSLCGSVFLFGAESVAFVKSVKGDATLQRENKTHLIQSGEKLYPHDVIATSEKSTVGISFQDGTRVALGAKSHLKIDEFLFDPSKKNFRFDLSLDKGSAVFESGKIGKLAPEKVSFKVPQGIVGIRGTKFLVEVE